MALTSNETAWGIAIISFLFSSFNLWVNISTKSTVVIAQVKRKIIRLFLKFFMFSSSFAALYILFYEFTLSTPITRIDVLLITLAMTVLFLVLITIIVERVHIMSKTNLDHAEITNDIVKYIEKQDKSQRP